jgi:hypothetical protein
MNKKILIICAIVVSIFGAAQLGCSNVNRPTHDSAILRALPANCIWGYAYRCKDMVVCVNALKRIGKNRTLSAMKEYAAQVGDGRDPMDGEKLLLVCRILFINEKGWQTPALGQPVPANDWKYAEQYPLFPIAISEGVPFLLINGYRSGGMSRDMTPDACIQDCEKLSIRSQLIPEGNYKKAAEELINSKYFQQLYVDPKWKEIMTAEIRAQAQ